MSAGNVVIKSPVASYSLTQSPMQYHRRRREADGPGQVLPHSTASAPVDIPSMADSDHVYYKLLIMDRIENAVGALANPIDVPARELLISPGTGIFGEGRYPVDYASSVPAGTDLLNLSCSRRLDDDPISCHGA